MSSRSSSSVNFSRFSTSDTLRVSSRLAESISRPARVTSRANLSGRIAASPRPLDLPRRPTCVTGGLFTVLAGSKPLPWRSRSMARRASASSRSPAGSSTLAFWRQRSTQAISSRSLAYSVSKTLPLPRAPSAFTAGRRVP